MLKKTFTTACVIFTVLVALYSLINLALYGSDSDSYLALSSLRVFLFFPFSLAVSFANSLFEVRSLDGWLKVALHFIITMAAAFLCLVLPISADTTPSAMLMGMFLFLLLYVLVAAVLGILRSRRKREENAKQDYAPVYRKSIDKK